MIILGIDTSCDDTCIALLKIENCKLKILSNIVSSQVKIHQKYGGVYPFLAKREHQRNLPLVLRQALSEGRLLKSKIKEQKSKIDAIGVTVGPGLEPCLWTGINFAKDLAKKFNLPIVQVNHIEAHIIANWLLPICSKPKTKNQKSKMIFPAVCLVVSGGHTQLILMKDIRQYKLIGETRDDAAGECFDKTARILGLGYPGGPAVALEAKKFQVSSSKFQVKLPRPMIGQKNYDFSFSGLKTAVLYDFQGRSPRERKSNKYLQAMAFEIQQAIIDVLIHKTLKAAKNFGVKSIILGGGVAANDELRKEFKIQSSKLKVNFLIPPKNLCTDNAAMIALTAFFQEKNAIKNLKKIKANANLKI